MKFIENQAKQGINRIVFHRIINSVCINLQVFYSVIISKNTSLCNDSDAVLGNISMYLEHKTDRLAGLSG